MAVVKWRIFPAAPLNRFVLPEIKTVMGPTAAVLLPDSDPATVDVLIADAYARIGTIPDDANIRDILDVWVTTTVPIGGAYVGDERPFAVRQCSHDRMDATPSDIAAIRDELGVTAHQSIELSANCNQPADHRILAELCAYFAQTTGGIVDFSGQLTPGIPDAWQRDWREIEPLFKQRFASFPGRIISVLHPSMHREHRFAAHYATPDFVWAWSRDPQCYMIK